VRAASAEYTGNNKTLVDLEQEVVEMDLREIRRGYNRVNKTVQ
jgi:hypothetical protein